MGQHSAKFSNFVGITYCISIGYNPTLKNFIDQFPEEALAESISEVPVRLTINDNGEVFPISAVETSVCSNEIPSVTPYTSETLKPNDPEIETVHFAELYEEGIVSKIIVDVDT